MKPTLKGLQTRALQACEEARRTLDETERRLSARSLLGLPSPDGNALRVAATLSVLRAIGSSLHYQLAWWGLAPAGDLDA